MVIVCNIQIENTTTTTTTKIMVMIFIVAVVDIITIIIPNDINSSTWLMLYLIGPGRLTSFLFIPLWTIKYQVLGSVQFTIPFFSNLLGLCLNLRQLVPLSEFYLVSYSGLFRSCFSSFAKLRDVSLSSVQILFGIRSPQSILYLILLKLMK